MNSEQNLIYLHNLNIKEDFINARILITGASSGIGRSAALFFLNAGAKVVLCGRDIDTLKSIGSEFPGQAAVVKLDLSIDIHTYDLKTSVIQILGGIDIIINCAGVYFDGDLEKTFPQDYDYTMDVNLRSVFIILTSFYEFMDVGASVINLSCLAGSTPQAGVMSHCISKAGLELLTKYCAAEFAGKGIRVNAITCAPIDTNCQRFVGVSDQEYYDYKSRTAKNIPLERMGVPDDIVKAIIFLACKRSANITGNIMKIDGGRSLTSSGFVPYKGMKNMNSRFEPDDVDSSNKMNGIWDTMTNTFNKLTGNKKQEKSDVKFPMSEEDIEKLIDESNFGKKIDNK